MNGIISGIKRMEIHDGDGLRTTVFFKGCSLRCIWCHNPECLSFEKQIAVFENNCIHCNSCVGVCESGAMKERRLNPSDNKKCTFCERCVSVCPVCAIVSYGESLTPYELAQELLSDELFFKNSGGGVTFSGGECLMQIDFAVETAKLIKEKGVSVFIDTCGFVPRENFKKIIPYTDKFLYDIKAITPLLHKELTGYNNELILENLRFISESGCKTEIRFPLVKGYNDGECGKIAEFIATLSGIEGIKVLRYHNLAASRYDALGIKNTLPDSSTTEEDVHNATEIFKKHNIPIIE